MSVQFNTQQPLVHQWLSAVWLVVIAGLTELFCTLTLFYLHNAAHLTLWVRINWKTDLGCNRNSLYPYMCWMKMLGLYVRLLQRFIRERSCVFSETRITVCEASSAVCFFFFIQYKETEASSSLQSDVVHGKTALLLSNPCATLQLCSASPLPGYSDLYQMHELLLSCCILFINLNGLSGKLGPIYGLDWKSCL